ncbi:hypothetical protein HWV62_26288 [Athelia sp. TMB]|nr:hypothetical protein HWV62_26288 [Athelia sp. TMB]
MSDGLNTETTDFFPTVHFLVERPPNSFSVHRTSRTLDARRAAFRSPISIAIIPATGKSTIRGHSDQQDDADRAIKDLDGKELRGRPVRVALDDSPETQRGGPDNYRRDDRYDRPRDDRPPRDDRYRDDRYSRDDRYRRDRSRSPPRRTDYDDRRPRSPPPKREDDRRPAGYDYYDRYERRGGVYDKASDYDDRRRDDYERPRREERRPREEREPREPRTYEERPAKSGDGGWSR